LPPSNGSRIGRPWRPARSQSLPFNARKAKLTRLLARKPAGIVLNEHTDEDGATVFRHACKLGLKGIVSKRLSAPYRPVAGLA
jgi:bifunctional non-homologous end joining protein LigD